MKMGKEEAAGSRDAPWRSIRSQRRTEGGNRFADLFQAWGNHEVLSVDDEDEATSPSPRQSRWGQDPWPTRSRLRGSDPPARYFSDRAHRKSLVDPAPSYIPLQTISRSPKEYIPLQSDGFEESMSIPTYSRGNFLMDFSSPAVTAPDKGQDLVNRIHDKLRKSRESESMPPTYQPTENRSDTSSASSMAITPSPLVVDHVHTDADESGELHEEDDEEIIPQGPEFNQESGEPEGAPPEDQLQENTMEHEVGSVEGADGVEAESVHETDLAVTGKESDQCDEVPESDHGMDEEGDAMAEPVEEPSQADAKPAEPSSDQQNTTESTVHTYIVPRKGDGRKAGRLTLTGRKGKLDKTRRSGTLARRLKEEPNETVSKSVTFEKDEIEKCGLLLRTNLECSCVRNKILEMALNYRELRRQEESLRKDLAPLLRSAGSSAVSAISPQFDTAVRCLLKAVAGPVIKQERRQRRRRTDT